MPVMDGYRATHTIRNAKFSSDDAIRNVPIVAMTASAIQGDKEKCQRAGMDDYLAKPVKSMLLEKMLVKWAIEGRNKRMASHEMTRSSSLYSDSGIADGVNLAGSNETIKNRRPPPRPQIPQKQRQTRH